MRLMARNASLKGAFFIHAEEINFVQIYLLDPRHNVIKDYGEKKKGIISITLQYGSSLVIKKKKLV